MNPEPLIGITTHASRIRFIEPCLNSLLQQSVRPSRIVLSIPDRYLRFGDAPELPEFVRVLEASGRLEVVRIPDCGPATKIAGPWSVAGDDELICWCDDDRIYHPQLVECLMSSRSDGMAVGAGGIRYTNTPITHHTPKGFNVDLLQGYAGVLCRKRDMPSPLKVWSKYVDTDPQKMDRFEWSFFLSDDYVFSEALKEFGTVLFGLFSSEMNFGISSNPLPISDVLPVQYSNRTGGIHSAYRLLRREGVQAGRILT